MPLELSTDGPTLFVRRDAFERVGLTRSSLDDRLNLTAEEFRVEGNLVAVGPLVGDQTAGDLLAELESLGLTYFEDFFELPGSRPAWLRLVAIGY